MDVHFIIIKQKSVDNFPQRFTGKGITDTKPNINKLFIKTFNNSIDLDDFETKQTIHNIDQS